MAAGLSSAQKLLNAGSDGITAINRCLFYWERSHSLFMIVRAFICQGKVVQVLFDWHCLQWSSFREEARSGHNVTYDGVGWLVETDTRFLYIAAGCAVLLVVVSEIWVYSFFSLTLCSSKTLHEQMFTRVLRAPIMFFETHPLGRILNRFSRDTSFMDVRFPRDLILCFGIGFHFLAMLVFIVVVNVWLVVAVIPLAVLMFLIRQYSMNTIRDLRRLDATSRTPIYTILMDTIHGLSQIRAMGKNAYFEEQFKSRVDENTSAYFLYFNTYRWLGVRIEGLVTLLLVAALVGAIATRTWDSGLLGLGLTYTALIFGGLQFLMRSTAEVESLMTSIERICQYRELEQEAAARTDVSPPEGWPSQGHISMQHVSLHYTKTHDESEGALKDINLNISAEEKIGVVGRTGAGKSSLINILLRLVEPQGTILIDGLDISKLGLNDLRQRIAVIPQDPILLRGTLRKNMDPFTDHADDDIWEALGKVYMKETISEMDGALYCEVSESGSNFSVGQKQLLCLARAILRDNRILLVDEATANVDNRTDALVQETIRQSFRNSTVVTIAHRLHTVMDSDRVLVMSEGRVEEFDHPHILLQQSQSHLLQLVHQTGPEEEEMLVNIARINYLEKQSVSIAEKKAI